MDYNEIELIIKRRWQSSLYGYVYYRLKNKIPKRKTWFDKLFNDTKLIK